MKTRVSHRGVFFFLVFTLCCCKTGRAAVPEVLLPSPQNQAEKDYLGVSAGATFKLSESAAPVLIVEFFSFYCSSCRKEAPAVNELYAKIETNPDLKGKIKLLGIGIGNDPDEVAAYKKKHATPFPLFPDKKVQIMKSLGAKGTPTFLILQKQANGTLRKLHTKT